MNLVFALLCVFLFGLTAPFTRMAALETTPEAVILFRILGASLISIIAIVLDGWVPPRSTWKGIACTAIGSVIGFATFMTFAMKDTPAGHAAVSMATLPIVTATYSVLRDKSRPGPMFWFFALAGTLLSFVFFFVSNVSGITHGDFLLMMSVLASAFGYVEGGRMSRQYGGRRIMSWAIVFTLPVTMTLCFFYFKNFSVLENITYKGWISVAYLASISQSLGMFLWFKVLAKGPMEKIALVQLLQPFFTFVASIILLGEEVGALTWLIAILVASCVFGANSARKKT
jgi:drug/metabolite transporter (DMT)-like permease